MTGNPKIDPATLAKGEEALQAAQQLIAKAQADGMEGDLEDDFEDLDDATQGSEQAQDGEGEGEATADGEGEGETAPGEDVPSEDDEDAPQGGTVAKAPGAGPAASPA